MNSEWTIPKKAIPKYEHRHHAQRSAKEMNNEQQINKVKVEPQHTANTELLLVKPNDAWRWDERVPSSIDNEENKNTLEDGGSPRSQLQEQQRWSSSILRGVDTATTSNSATTRHPATSSIEKQQRRMQLALFIKILLKSLRDENEILLHQQVRMVVSMVIRGHKLTGTSDRPLEDTIESHLRPLVGESHWNHTKVLQNYYLRNRQRYSCSRRSVGSHFNRHQHNSFRHQPFYSVDPRTIVEI